MCLHRYIHVLNGVAPLARQHVSTAVVLFPMPKLGDYLQHETDMPSKVSMEKMMYLGTKQKDKLEWALPQPHIRNTDQLFFSQKTATPKKARERHRWHLGTRPYYSKWKVVSAIVVQSETFHLDATHRMWTWVRNSGLSC